jgi:hypothetical protein
MLISITLLIFKISLVLPNFAVISQRYRALVIFPVFAEQLKSELCFMFCKLTQLLHRGSRRFQFPDRVQQPLLLPRD